MFKVSKSLKCLKDGSIRAILIFILGRVDQHIVESIVAHTQTCLRLTLPRIQIAIRRLWRAKSCSRQWKTCLLEVLLLETMLFCEICGLNGGIYGFKSSKWLVYILKAWVKTILDVFRLLHGQWLHEAWSRGTARERILHRLRENVAWLMSWTSQAPICKLGIRIRPSSLVWVLLRYLLMNLVKANMVLLTIHLTLGRDWNLVLHLCLRYMTSGYRHRHGGIGSLIGQRDLLVHYLRWFGRQLKLIKLGYKLRRNENVFIRASQFLSAVSVRALLTKFASAFLLKILTCLCLVVVVRDI